MSAMMYQHTSALSALSYCSKKTSSSAAAEKACCRVCQFWEKI